VSSLHRWVERHLHEAIFAPLTPYIQAITQVREQDLEMTKAGVRIRHGVAPERRISIEDSEMRHGRKSKSKRFDGYKEHIARDLDLPVILACAVTPANRPEEGAVPIRNDITAQRLELIELHIDRAYVNSPIVADLLKAKGKVFAKPCGFRPVRPGMFTKRDSRSTSEPARSCVLRGRSSPSTPAAPSSSIPRHAVHAPSAASARRLPRGAVERSRSPKTKRSRKHFRRLQQSRPGRQALRERVKVEHALAHVAARKGERARYVGVRKNLFDLRRAAVIQNLEAAQRQDRAA
jgi:hypothetical protein